MDIRIDLDSATGRKQVIKGFSSNIEIPSEFIIGKKILSVFEDDRHYIILHLEGE